MSNDLGLMLVIISMLVMIVYLSNRVHFVSNECKHIKSQLNRLQTRVIEESHYTHSWIENEKNGPRDKVVSLEPLEHYQGRLYD